MSIFQRGDAMHSQNENQGIAVILTYCAPHGGIAKRAVILTGKVLI